MTRAARIKIFCGALSGLFGLLGLFLIKTDVPGNIADVAVFASFGFAIPAIAVSFVEIYQQYR